MKVFQIKTNGIFLIIFCFSLLFLEVNYPAVPVNFLQNRHAKENNKEEEFENYSNKIIRSIHFEVRDVSAPSIEEDSSWKPSWFGKIGNSLHYKSRVWVIRERLLFKEGDKLDPKLLEESERILRTTGAFLDARIVIQPIKNSNDSTDILVITKDRWTLSFLVSYNTNAKNGYLGFSDENFLGMGHQVNLKFTHAEDRSIGMGGEFEYTAANIAGSFIDADARVESDRRSNFKSILLSRPFITSYIPWSGALEFDWLNNVFLFSNNSDGIFSYPYKQISQDIWLGRTFKFPFFNSLIRNNTDIFLSGRILHVDFPVIPQNPNISKKIFDSYTRYLFSAGIIHRRFYKDNFVNGFGITEDIPIGGLISATFGRDIRSSTYRWYSGLEALYSKRVPGLGYASADFKIGGFRYLGTWEQNVINLNLIYHTELIKKENWKYRFFFQSDLLEGLKRLEGEQIYLNSESNVRGLDNIILFGTKRITVNLEGRLFSPFSPLGFVLGGIIFTDLGLISGPGISISQSKLYQSYGLGLRTRNESITNTNFVLSIAYIPINNRTKGGTFKILFNTSVVLGSRDFGLSSPSVFNFGDNR